MIRPLSRQRAFVALFAAQLTSALNDNLFKTALIIWITARGASVLGLSPAAMLGLVSALFIAPFFLVSASAGQLADRHDKAAIVRAVKLAELGIMALASWGFASGSVVAMLAALSMMGVHSAVLGPVKYSILPQLVAPDQLVQANALVEMGTFLAILAGTVAGGMLGAGQNGAGWLTGCVMVVSLIGLLASMALPRLTAADPTLRVHANPFTPMRQVLRITARTRSVFLSVLGISHFWLLGVVMLSFLPAYVHDTLRADEQVVTALFALFCVGIALGSLLTERISGKNLELGLVPLGSIGMTLCLLDLAFLELGRDPGTALLTLAEFSVRQGSLRLAADLFFLALFGGLFTVPLYTLIQQRADPEERSRVVAGNNILNALFMVAGSLLLSVAESAALGSRWVFLSLALLSAGAAIYIYTLVPEFLLRFVAWVLGRTAYRMVVRGHENIPESGPVVLVCNHVAFNDWLVVAGAVRRPVRFVMDHRMAKTPLLAGLLKQGKTIPIAAAHEDEQTMEQAFVRIAEELRAGEIVCIYPEGKITHTGAMNPFKTGIERILRETPVQVVPMAVHGLWGSTFSRKHGPAMSKLPRRFRARVTLQIGTPMAAGDASARTLEQAVQQLHVQASGG